MKQLQTDILIDNKLLEEFLNIELYKKLISSKSFKRLKNIAFLGAIDYKYNNQKRFYRYEHSVGVALLAYYYAKLKNFDKKHTDYLVVAALLHDIGHPPLSHSTEFAFKTKFNMHHHKVGIDIIKGKNLLFKDEIKSIINKYEMDEEYICKLLNKEIDNELSFVLNNPINVDTIDGISRTYITQNYRQKYKAGFIYKPVDIVKALVNKDTKILNCFWELKDRMYHEFIHHQENLLLDEVTKEFVLKCNISEKEYLQDDKQFFQKYNLNLNIKHLKNREINKEIKFKKRKYFIKGVIINSYNDFYENYKVDKYEDIIIYQNNLKGHEKCLLIF